MTTAETIAELRRHSTEELIHCRESARKLNTPRAWEVRFFIIKIMLERSLGLT